MYVVMYISFMVVKTTKAKVVLTGLDFSCHPYTHVPLPLVFVQTKVYLLFLPTKNGFSEISSLRACLYVGAAAFLRVPRYSFVGLESKVRFGVILLGNFFVQNFNFYISLLV